MRPDEVFAVIRAKFSEAKEETGTNGIIIPKESLLEVSRYLKNLPLA
jgi:hypothetical protein